MFRHVFVLAMVALVGLVGANAAFACCGWGGGCGYGGGWSGCGYGGGWGGGCGHYGGGYYGGGCGFGGHCYGGYHGGYYGGHHHYAVTTATPVFVASQNDRARLVVSLPADATLFVDGQRTSATSAQRTFVSPPIDNGKTYYYTLTAEVNRDGVSRTVTETVYVRPGQTTQVSLTIPETGNAVAGR